MTTSRRQLVPVLAVLGATLLAGVPARAAGDSAATFFHGKQMRFYTMGSPGGGYDTYMRALIPHLEKKLGAKMLPTNEPGAGGLIAVNRTINAPADGLTILLIGGETLVTAQLYGSPGVNYDVRKLTWLARVSSEAKVALLGPKSPYNSVRDMAKSETPVTWAGSGKIDGNADFTAIMAHALGMKSKIITGYKGTGGMNLAIQRGEVDGRVVSEESAALYGPSNGMRVVAVLARKRVKQFPAAPTLFEAAELGPAQARLIDWRASIAGLGRLMVVTPGTPPDRVALLQETFADVIRDPGFIADVKKLSLSANHAGADEVRATVEQAMTTLDEAGLAEVRHIALERYYQ
jgi:tripartite-type tricarboxylate transporter receptor subunit TctC